MQSPQWDEWMASVLEQDTAAKGAAQMLSAGQVRESKTKDRSVQTSKEPKCSRREIWIRNLRPYGWRQTQARFRPHFRECLLLRSRVEDRHPLFPRRVPQAGQP